MPQAGDPGDDGTIVGKSSDILVLECRHSGWLSVEFLREKTPEGASTADACVAEEEGATPALPGITSWYRNLVSYTWWSTWVLAGRVNYITRY